MSSESFAGPMQLAAHGIAALAGENADLFVAQLLIGHEQQQKAIFFGNSLESFLDALPELTRFEDAQGTFRGTGGSFPDFIIVGAMDMSTVPGLKQVSGSD
jgi:hypothetical protein